MLGIIITTITIIFLLNYKLHESNNHYFLNFVPPVPSIVFGRCLLNSTIFMLYREICKGYIFFIFLNFLEMDIEETLYLAYESYMLFA